MNKETKNFMSDLIDLLKEDALRAKKDAKKHKNEKDTDFYNGVLQGYWEVLTTIENQLKAFQIQLKEVKFDIDPDKDLMGMKGRDYFKKKK